MTEGGRHLGWALLAWAALCAASYASRDFANNDFERLHDAWRTGAFAAILTALVLAYAALIDRRVSLPRGLAWGGFLALALLAGLTFPVGSKDVFLYVFYGKLWQVYGANPHLQAPAQFAADPWYRFLADWPRAPASLYGPLFSLQMRLIAALSAGHVAVAVALQKALGAALVGAAALLLAALRGGAAGRAGGGWLVLWLWSPLVLFESIATPHNDVAMTVLILGACALWLRDRPAAAAAALALAFWYKWYALVLAPVWLARALRCWPRRRWLWRATAAAAAVSALALLPFAGDLSAMAARALEGHGVRELFPDELPPPLWLLMHGFAAAGLLASPAGLVLFNGVRGAVLLGGLAWLVWRRRGAGDDPGAFLCDCFWSIALFFAVVPTQLWPWHLVVLCALALATRRRGYELIALGLTAAGLLSYFLTFAYATAACGLAAGALWWMRRRRIPAAPTPPG